MNARRPSIPRPDCRSQRAYSGTTTVPRSSASSGGSPPMPSEGPRARPPPAPTRVVPSGRHSRDLLSKLVHRLQHQRGPRRPTLSLHPTEPLAGTKKTVSGLRSWSLARLCTHRSIPASRRDPDELLLTSSATAVPFRSAITAPPPSGRDSVPPSRQKPSRQIPQILRHVARIPRRVALRRVERRRDGDLLDRPPVEAGHGGEEPRDMSVEPVE